jgi:hypothetical protein
MAVEDPVLQPMTVLVEVFWEEGGGAHSVSLRSILLGPAQS